MPQPWFRAYRTDIVVSDTGKGRLRRKLCRNGDASLIHVFETGRKTNQESLKTRRNIPFTVKADCLTLTIK
ncbi:hypothetical protein BC936DRAFT_137269 [Jimgerdemannia flammicorona]|uniref:Uncharacterized protein n=2 Tax=Jimgerdemannia flammicorona TaxID=994334 RepID=A0A433PFB1_9FUNG|nr:hypothetical protein BC936DRAFT_137269 [Jimgerdemannia flammicorona]RUS16221.1 hypothetical protein BC938DRAFT_476656 [Jimgerdemannia flammicorona]